MNFKQIIIGASLLLSSGLANANIIGNLTYNLALNEITGDGFTYLGWDVLKSLTYAETVSATSTGGAYSDYRIANETDANQFYTSLLSGGTTTPQWYNGIFGDNYYSFADVAWFLTDNSSANKKVGYIYLYNHSFINDSWSHIINSDYYADNNANSISWLLVKDATTVPEPSILMLFGFGIFFLLMDVSGRKKQK